MSLKLGDNMNLETYYSVDIKESDRFEIEVPVYDEDGKINGLIELTVVEHSNDTYTLEQDGYTLKDIKDYIMDEIPEMIPNFSKHSTFPNLNITGGR